MFYPGSELVQISQILFVQNINNMRMWNRLKLFWVVSGEKRLWMSTYFLLPDPDDERTLNLMLVTEIEKCEKLKQLDTAKNIVLSIP